MPFKVYSNNNTTINTSSPTGVKQEKSLYVSNGYNELSSENFEDYILLEDVPGDDYTLPNSKDFIGNDIVIINKSGKTINVKTKMDDMFFENNTNVTLPNNIAIKLLPVKEHKWLIVSV